jgi:hypothetical protein
MYTKFFTEPMIEQGSSKYIWRGCERVGGYERGYDKIINNEKAPVF